MADWPGWVSKTCVVCQTTTVCKTTRRRGWCCHFMALDRCLAVIGRSSRTEAQVTWPLMAPRTSLVQVLSYFPCWYTAAPKRTPDSVLFSKFLTMAQHLIQYGILRGSSAVDLTHAG